MKRDGASTSLWQNNIQEYNAQQPGLPQKLFDVVIVGGGITGLSTALLLQKSGKACILLEAHTLGFGTTSGTTAHLNTFIDTTYDEIEKDFSAEKAKLVAQATREAIEQIKQHTITYNIDCGFKELPGYVFSQTEEQAAQLDKVTDASLDAGLSISYVQSIPVPIDFNKAIQIDRQAQFHPTKYIIALAKAFEEAGGTIIEQCQVKEADDKEVVKVKTTLGDVQSKKLIYATHIPPGINLLHLRCAPYRSYAIAVTLQDDQYPDALVYDMYEPYHYYRTQEVDGKKYLVAGGEDHKTAHEENTEACLRNLESYVRKYFKVAEVSYRWSSQFYEPADGLPYIGVLPGNSDNILVATGFSGNGMTFSNVAAIVLRDIIVTGSSKYEEVFNPKRIKPVAGFTNFVKENVDVAKELVGRWLSKEKLEELSGIATGEARVVKYENNTVAIYKDEKGTIHAVNPACTHMKCQVSWNNAEQSWDCPCHGARYEYDGTVLNGPATKPLGAIELSELVKDA
jgi:glycine/D-amino acid oxidase-like deaminating enzyme/nitrite reductase/ring-hydroxylating ferredoxin subunit